MDTLPIEILEKIIKCASKSYYSSKYQKCYLKSYALVCRKWAIIANPLIWKEVELDNISNERGKRNEFYFYRHIIKPGYVCGKYIQKLSLVYSKLWPICILKILQACPNIVDLTIESYSYYDKRGNVNNFLEQIQVLLPKLRRLNLEFSHNEITGIEKLIEDRKDLYILATRNNNSSFCDKYNGKKWELNEYRYV